MAPPPCFRICRSSCFMQVQTPRRLTAFTSSKPVGGLLRHGAHRAEDAGIVVGHVEPAECGDGALAPSAAA